MGLISTGISISTEVIMKYLYRYLIYDLSYQVPSHGNLSKVRFRMPSAKP